MNKYFCWDEDTGSEDCGMYVDASDPNDAAEEFARRQDWSDAEVLDERVVVVRCGQGDRRFRVEARREVTYYADELGPVTEWEDQDGGEEPGRSWDDFENPFH